MICRRRLLPLPFVPICLGLGFLLLSGGCYTTDMAVRPVLTGDQRLQPMEGTPGLLISRARDVGVTSTAPLNQFGTGFEVLVANRGEHPIVFSIANIVANTDTGIELELLDYAELTRFLDDQLAIYEDHMAMLSNNKGASVPGVNAASGDLIETRRDNMMRRLTALIDMNNYAAAEYLDRAITVLPGKQTMRRIWVRLPPRVAPDAVIIEVRLADRAEAFVFELGRPQPGSETYAAK